MQKAAQPGPPAVGQVSPLLRVWGLETTALENEACMMRFFGGLSAEEIAQVLKVSTVTVKRDWRTAQAWLYR